MPNGFYVINKTPVFLTFQNYNKVLRACESQGMLDANRPMAFADDKREKQEEYNAICLYLLQLQKENPKQYDNFATFSCYDDEAKDNLYALLENFGAFYSRQNRGLFSAPYFGFRKIHQKEYSPVEELVFEFTGDMYDIRFPIGRRYYFCYTNRKKTAGIELLIDTDAVESLHGTLESFIVFFKTGLVLKGNSGNISMYIDAVSSNGEQTENATSPVITTNGKISYYKKDGTLERQQELNNDNIGDTNGMMVRCIMKNGTIHEGFSDPFRTQGEPKYDGAIHDFIYLWTWDNLNEETHQLTGDSATKFNQTFTPLAIQEIGQIDAILYSNPRWGGRLTNHFFINTP